MPNWCDGDVFVYGDKEVLENIIAKGKEGTYENGTDWNKETRSYDKIEVLPNVFSFENFLPLDGQDAHSIWGTKWDLNQYGVSVSEVQKNLNPEVQSDFYICICFSTAWSPALELFTEISVQYPVYIEYRFCEPGMNFFGIARIEDGNCDEDIRDIEKEDYIIAGVPLDEDGELDFENAPDDYDIYKALDIWKEYENENKKGVEV